MNKDLRKEIRIVYYWIFALWLLTFINIIWLICLEAKMRGI